MIMLKEAEKSHFLDVYTTHEIIKKNTRFNSLPNVMRCTWYCVKILTRKLFYSVHSFFPVLVILGLVLF